MLNDTASTSTRPYLIRALHEWCVDNGLTPFITVQVDETTQVPKEYVKNKEIVLNVSFDATSGLKLGNAYIEFKGRFGGVARDIIVPVNRVIAIFARENSQGMAFPSGLQEDTPASDNSVSVTSAGPAATKPMLASVTSVSQKDEVSGSSHKEPSDVTHKAGKLVAVERVSVSTPVPEGDSTEPTEPNDPPSPKPASGARPTLTRVK